MFYVSIKHTLKELIFTNGNIKHTLEELTFTPLQSVIVTKLHFLFFFCKQLKDDNF